MANFRPGKHVECLVCGEKYYLRYNESFVASDKTCNCKGPRKVRIAHMHPEPDACCGSCEKEEVKSIKKRAKCPCKPKEDE